MSDTMIAARVLYFGDQDAGNWLIRLDSRRCSLKRACVCTKCWGPPMPTEAKTWESMTARERDAWVAVRLFDYRWVIDDETALFEKPPNIDPLVRTYHRLGVHVRVSDQYDGETDFGLCPHYTTDPAADYAVLVHVRENWEKDKLYLFWAKLGAVLGNRMYGRDDLQDQHRNGFEERLHYMSAYQPGDYAHAAYLVMTEGCL